jgi:hypothetical protein
MYSDDIAGGPDPSTPNLSEEQEAEKKALLLSSRSGKLDTIQEKIAWILNHYPATRDSDTALAIKFWQEFQPELLDGAYVELRELYKLTKATTITRARAKIQNTYQLFQATLATRKVRGTLAASERDKAVQQRMDFPLTTVFADESGKNGKALIVGSIWIVHPPEHAALYRKIGAWKKDHSFEGELHFANLNRNNVDRYCAFVDFIAENSAVLGFKAISLERQGIRNVDSAISKLYYLLLVAGIEHEDKTSRAPLPRTLSLWKDSEEESRDKMFLAELNDKLKQAAATRFKDQLEIDQLEVADSKDDPFIQLADLFTSSINRTLNSDPQNDNPKDRFANYFLDVIGMTDECLTELREDDIITHLRL